jgi:hypothetical protein
LGEECARGFEPVGCADVLKSLLRHKELGAGIGSA